ncbi:hypothetical protein [Halalkalicoccus tibetensis]|uniref:Uncharacterized protein n=1 Tax=Halalkalicoccus tibetensis TaxID=175632 RepID=A0ABD5V386_9EURY
MPSNPVERNFLTRFILGFAVIGLMSIGGGAVARPLVSMVGPIAGFIGALIVFVLFARWYTRYDASFAE